MKRLTSTVLALLLVIGGNMALADRGEGGNHQGWRGHGYKHGHHKGHWNPRPYYREVHYYSHHDHYRDRDYYYPLGAALIGAAVTYSIFHSHDNGYSGSGASTEVVGCHRIERYPDGSERRVEVSMSECY